MDCAELVGNVAARFDSETSWLQLRFPVPDYRPAVAVFVVSVAADRARAGLADVRLHDLRHSFASFLVNEGVSLYVVQALLGHANARTTQRYAHLASDTLSDATEIVDGIVAAQPRTVAPSSAAPGVHVGSW